jgi:drug/metabolite transporter (DMT)-like permease
MKIKSVLFAVIIYLFFSLSSVFMKFASLQNNIFYKLVFFGLSILTLGFFSIAWQKLLNKFALSKVYFFKATTIIWGMIFGILLFNEKVTINMIIGAIITALGVAEILVGEKHD